MSLLSGYTKIRARHFLSGILIRTLILQGTFGVPHFLPSTRANFFLVAGIVAPFSALQIGNGEVLYDDSPESSTGNINLRFKDVFLASGVLRAVR